MNFADKTNWYSVIAVLNTEEQIATGLGEVQKNDVRCTKVLRNGVVMIERNGVLYDVQGRVVERVKE